MIQEHKYLVIIWCACLALIGIAAGVKIDQSRQQIKTASVTPVSRTEPVYVDPEFYEDNPSNSEEVVNTINTATPPPIQEERVTAKSYVVGSIKTGKIYLQKNADTIMPLASMTKILTALVATRIIPASTTPVITESNLKAPADLSSLKLGERFTTDEILYPLLITSSNVAAEALAESVGRDNFMRSMSVFAEEIGMNYSAFQDPSGVSIANVSTARDVFALAKYIFLNEPEIINVIKTSSFSIATTSEHGSHVLHNTHPMVREPNYMGGKTGYTPEAGDTMVTVLKIGGDPIAFIVLGAVKGRREADTRLLMKELGEVQDH